MVDSVDVAYPVSRRLLIEHYMHLPHVTSRLVISRSEKEGTKPPYVCPGCSNHTHGNNMINRCNVMNKRVIFLT
jgi:hypothetical protein